MTRLQATVLAATAAALVSLPCAAQMIPRDAAPKIAGLLGDVGDAHPLPGGYVFSDVRIDRDRVTMVLTGTGGAVAGRIQLLPPGEAEAGDRHSKTFAIRVERLDPKAKDALEAGVASIVHHDPGGLFYTPSGPAPAVTEVRVLSGLSRAWHGVLGSHRPTRVTLSPAWRRGLWLAQVLLALALFAGTAVFVLRRRGRGAAPPPSP